MMSDRLANNNVLYAVNTKEKDARIKTMSPRIKVECDQNNKKSTCLYRDNRILNKRIAEGRSVITVDGTSNMIFKEHK